MQPMRSLAVTQLAAFTTAYPQATLLDVREPWEVALASVPAPGCRTQSIPMGQIPARLAEIDRSQPVVCLCHHGMRSAQVVAFLMRQGEGEVYNLAGGIDAWSTEVDPAVPRY
jgi:rhodanese-related sulfurtransferase